MDALLAVQIMLWLSSALISVCFVLGFIAFMAWMFDRCQ